MRKLTIITPCCRPNNLKIIIKSLDFDFIDEWIIVYDQNKIPKNLNLFKSHIHCNKIKEFIYKTDNDGWGNSQRNYGIETIQNKDAYVYFLDDDNIIHPNLYTFLNTISDDDKKIYTFNQDNHGKISTGNRLYVGGLDTAIFLMHYNYLKRWHLNRHEADALFFLDCYNDNKENYEYVDKVLCYYNYLQ